MSKAGRSGDITRAPRNNNVPKENDEQTQLEFELASSGRNDAFPREGLVGAHAERRAPAFQEVSEEVEAESEEGQEPTGPGSDVAPTKRAEARERERHRIEREIGHTPAGEEGLVRGRNAPGVSREDLDEAARRADRRVVGHDLPKKRA
jgi:hypothetical protein